MPQDAKEKARQRAKIWYYANKERALATRSRWQKDNPDKVSIRNNKWKQANKDTERKRHAIRKKNKPEIFAALESKRRAAKIHRCPIWADLEAIKEKYKEASRLEKETGLLYHVDHIIPLRGRLVSGLHVDYNLQVMPAEENMKKHNRFEVV